MEHNGRILFDHYTSQETVEKLIQLGDISSLGPNIGEKHPFEWRTLLHDEFHKKYPDDYKACARAQNRSARHRKWDAMCLAYHRDRGEPWEQVKPQEG